MIGRRATSRRSSATAHALRGASANVGATTLAAVCARDGDARPPRRSSIATAGLVEPFDAEFARVRDALNQLGREPADMRILIADDDATSRVVLDGHRDQAGPRVPGRDRRIEAWELLSAEEIDVLLTDWMMPGLDGPELCRRVRDELQRPATSTSC